MNGYPGNAASFPGFFLPGFGMVVTAGFASMNC
jgi:hypothetical protein